MTMSSSRKRKSFQMVESKWWLCISLVFVGPTMVSVIVVPSCPDRRSDLVACATSSSIVQPRGWTHHPNGVSLRLLDCYCYSRTPNKPSTEFPGYHFSVARGLGQERSAMASVG